VSPEAFREIALAIPHACESAHVGHPDFRVGGKVFASLGAPDANWGMVKLTLEEQRAFMAKAPDVFTPCNGAWGKRGYTNVRLASAAPAILRPALEAAAKNVIPRVRKRPV
jgi:hypothetical protein